MSQNFSAELTDAVADEICARSAAGEGVVRIIEDMGLPADALDWLKARHGDKVMAAKRTQLAAARGT